MAHGWSGKSEMQLSHPSVPAANTAFPLWAMLRMLSGGRRLVKGTPWRAGVGRVRIETFSATC